MERKVTHQNFSTKQAALDFIAEMLKAPGVAMPVVVDCGYMVQVQLWDRAA